MTSRAAGTVRAIFWGVATWGLLAGCAGGDGPQERRDKAEFHYKLANGHFYEKEVVPALRELETCLKYDPKHPDAHHLSGFIFFGRKEYARAEGHFRTALEVRGGFHAARANLGALLMATRRWREAIEVLEPLLDATLYSTPWVAHNNIGQAYFELGKKAAARKHFRLAIFHNEKFCLAYTNLGRLHASMGHAEDAVEFLADAARKCDKYPDPHFHLAEILVRQGRVREARVQYETCWKDSPDSMIGRRCRRKL